jgi:hypothetical protein
MAIEALPSPTPASVVAEACTQVGEIADLLWSARTDEDLVATLEELERLRCLVAAIEAPVLVELDARQVPKKRLGWASSADWFTHLAGLRRGQGKRAIDRAHHLAGDRAATLEALRAGRISPEQSDVVCDAVDDLPGSPGLRADAEQVLIDEATRLNASELATAGRHVVEVVDPDRVERDLERQLDRTERAAHLDRDLSVTDDGAGGVRIRGRGSAEDGAVLRAALLPLTTPQPALDPETGADLTDPRDHGARMWDALIGLAQHALTTDLPPETHGARPRVAVTVDLDTLRDQAAHTASTDDGTELPPAALRRMACDSDLIPVALGSHGEILDVGRLVRLVTSPLWRALVCRDQHCTFPACTRPPVMCHAHHIVAWAHGGPTALHNLTLLCGHHHRLIHDTPWQVRLNPVDHRPEFRPPPKARSPVPVDWIRSRRRRE